MTAQEQGLAELVLAARLIVPPQLEFVILVYRQTGPISLSSCMFPSPTQTPLQQYERAKVAAQAFLTEKPRDDFAPRS